MIFSQLKLAVMKYPVTLFFMTFLTSVTTAKDIKTEILIQASPEKVWSILSDFDNYNKWNPFIKSIKGQVAVGNKISVRIEPPESKGMTFKPKVLTFETDKKLRWIGHFLFTGLFDGEHTFQLIDNGNGTTTFKQSEHFKGILVPLFKKSLKNTEKGFNLMNQKLKEMAEQKN
jgi:hypothetical protein